MTKLQVPTGVTSVQAEGMTFVAEDGVIDASDAPPEVMAKLLSEAGCIVAPPVDPNDAGDAALDLSKIKEKRLLVEQLQAAGLSVDARASIPRLRAQLAEAEALKKETAWKDAGKAPEPHG